MNPEGLECELCRENFEADQPSKFPKLLPCGHTFCAGCINKLIGKDLSGIWHCPVCRNASKVPLNASELTTNYTIMGLLGRLTITARCSKCFLIKKLEICIECKVLLCQKCLTDCFTGHLKNLKKTKTDTLTDFKEKHSHLLTKKYLENLEQIIRQNKKETKAINDHIEAIEKRVNSEKAALKEKLTELQENNVAYENLRSKAQGFIDLVDKWTNETYKNKEHLESDFNLINTKKEAVSQSIESISSSKLKTISIQLNNLQIDSNIIGDFKIVQIKNSEQNLLEFQLVTEYNELASGSDDKTIKIWDYKSGECLQTLQGHTDNVKALKFLGNSKLASGSDDKTIKIWDYKSGECLQTLQGHLGDVKALEYLGNFTLASGSQDATIKIWNYESGVCLRILNGHCNGVRSLQFLRHSKLASGSYDKTIRIWDFKSGCCLRTLNGHIFYVKQLQFLGENKLASASDDTTIRIWDFESGLCLRILQDHASDVYALQYLGNNKLASGSKDKKIKIWNIDAASCLRTLEGHISNINTLQYLGSNKLASGSKDKTIKIWNIESGSCLRTIECPKENVFFLQGLRNS